MGGGVGTYVQRPTGYSARLANPGPRRRVKKPYLTRTLMYTERYGATPLHGTVPQLTSRESQVRNLHADQ